MDDAIFQDFVFVNLSDQDHFQLLFVWVFNRFGIKCRMDLSLHQNNGCSLYFIQEINTFGINTFDIKDLADKAGEAEVSAKYFR